MFIPLNVVHIITIISIMIVHISIEVLKMHDLE
jgi:hypothetical protein